MPAMRITGFGGLVPRLAPRQLPDNGAQAAANVWLLSGELRPMRKSKEVYRRPLAQAIKSIYRVDDATWFVWPMSGVDMERAPLEGAARYIYTGDGAPKLTTLALGTPVSTTGTPAASRTLGIPRPQAAPSVAHSSGAGAAVSRFYTYTFYSDLNEEGPEAPVSALVTGTDGGSWALTGMDDQPANAGTITAATHAAGVVTITLGTGNHYLRAGEAFTAASVGGMTDLNGPWTVSAVPAPNQISIALTTAQTYTSGGTWARQSPWGPCTKRIYRSEGTGGQFQLVAEGVVGTTYTDTLFGIPGDDLISQAWEPPPATMIGLVAMSGGVMAGFIPGQRKVCFSEPLQPHAWPEAYQKRTNDDIVGIAAFDTNLAVATAGYPVVYSGSEPGQMSVTRHVKPFPCLSRESVCSVADGVVFATKNGLAKMNQVDVGMLTDSRFAPDGWNALGPAAMRCAYDGQRLFVHTETANRIYIMDLSNGGAMVNAYQPCECVIADSGTGDFYFAFARAVYRFDAFDTSPLSSDWWSKEFLLQKPATFTAAKVETDEKYSAEALAALQAERLAIIAANQALQATPTGGRGGYNSRAWNSGAWNGSVLAQVPDAEVSVTFSFYVDGKVIYTTQVQGQKMFRLPGGYRADQISVRIQANTQVRAVVLGSTPGDLANA